MEEKEIGVITHYFGKVGVGIVQLTDTLKVGDTVHIVGHSEEFSQQITSMQVEHQTVQEATAGQSVGFKVDRKLHENDKVFKVTG
ncbi:MAG: EF-Tu/IF-2/RF-3 family GTPase [Candidatus Omnitrophota bacterium]